MKHREMRRRGSLWIGSAPCGRKSYTVLLYYNGLAMFLVFVAVVVSTKFRLRIAV